MFSRSLLIASTLFFGVTVQSVNAADLSEGDVSLKCAVSQPNGKIELAFGKAENNSMTSDQYHGAVALSTPIDCLFGLQIDGLVAQSHGDTTLAAGVHLFARDPERYLLGFYGDVSASENNDSARLGVEGELYLDRVTLSGAGGWEDSNSFSDDKFFGVGQVSFYPNNNLNLNVGIAHTSGETFATFGGEWQPKNSQVSMFAQGATNGDGFNSIHGGIRIHFGAGQKSLIRRHREDDPSIWLAGTINKGTEVATFNKEQREENKLREIDAAKKLADDEAARIAEEKRLADEAAANDNPYNFTADEQIYADSLNCNPGYTAQRFMGTIRCLPIPIN